MKKDSNKSKMLACLLSCGLLALGTGCTDSDFDLSKIDATIGIGGDGLELPTSSTENIMLDDILELGNSDIISVSDNGDYMFSKEGDYCEPAHPNVSRVSINQAALNDNFSIDIVIPSSAYSTARKAARRVKLNQEISASGKVAEFDYNGSTPYEIKKLLSAGVASDVSIDVNLTRELKQLVSTFKTLTLSIPPYMHLNVTECSSSTYTYDAKTGKITLTNVSTAKPIYIKGVIDALDFQAKASTDNRLAFTPAAGTSSGSVSMKGAIETSVTFDEINAAAGTTHSNLQLSAKMSMGRFVINSAKGRFAPEIDLGELGNIEINDVPDFLTGDDVRVNLHNPVIELAVSSDISIAGKLSGKIIAKDKNNAVTATVSVPEITIKPNATTHICLCKYADEVDRTKYDEVKEVKNLSDIMAVIPKTITFVADADADDTQDAEITLGHEYTISPSYSVSAPLAFDEGAQIVYRDTLDGWNDDIKDCELAEGTYIEMKADIENKMPAYLNVSASAIGTDGREIPQERIEVAVSNSVKASADGSATTTPVTITLREKQAGALKSVDGLTFKVEAAAGEEGAQSIVGQTINAYRHTLTARNIKVKLVGKIIADFN